MSIYNNALVIEQLRSLINNLPENQTPGPEGKSAYEVAVGEGFKGDEKTWLASLVGPQGATISNVTWQDSEDPITGVPSTQVTLWVGDAIYDFHVPKIAGPTGPKGEPFGIAKIYSSIAAMNADFSTAGLKTGDFVLISTPTVENPDNAKLYVRTDTGYNFLTDMSGATGVQGPDGLSVRDVTIQGIDDEGNIELAFWVGEAFYNVEIPPAPPGPAGPTYTLTDGDKQDIADILYGRIGVTPLFGYIDDNKIIRISADLDVGETYDVRYFKEGNEIKIGNLTLSQSGATYTNQIPISTDLNGAIYDGTADGTGGLGWKTGRRLNSSGLEDVNTSYATREITGFIPATVNDVIYTKGITVTNSSGNYVVCYDENRSIVTYGSSGKAAFATSNFGTFDGSIVSFTLGDKANAVMNAEAQAKIKYFRLGADVIDNNSIITVNEPIE